MIGNSDTGALGTPENAAQDEGMEAAVRLASDWLDAPAAVICLVDERNWSASSFGSAVSRKLATSPINVLATVASGTVVVPDLLADERTYTAKVVIGAPRVRFYAGQPIRGPRGRTVGSLAVFGPEPRQLKKNQLAALRDLSILVESEFARVWLRDENHTLRHGLDQARKLALIDSLTATWNRAGIVEILGRELNRARRFTSPTSIIFADIDHFKRVNDTFGHLAGDEVLRSAASRLVKVVRPYDAVGRYGGEEFLIVAAGCDAEGAQRVAEGMRMSMRAHPFLLPTAGSPPLKVTTSIGVAVYGGDGRSTDEVIEAADEAMCRAKTGGRDKVEFAPTAVAAPY